MPGVRLAVEAAALHTDRGHSLGSLHTPPAAVALLPDFHWLRQFKGISNKKSAIPVGMTDFLELLARFELATSSLPRVEGLRPSVVALPAEPKPCYINGFSFLYVDKASPFYAGMSLSLTLIIL